MFMLLQKRHGAFSSAEKVLFSFYGYTVLAFIAVKVDTLYTSV